MERRYKIKVKLDRIDGGIPAHPDVIEVWIKQGIKTTDEELVDETIGSLSKEEIEEKLEKLTTTFKVNSKGQPCLEARCVKAAIKQTADVMGLYGTVTGLRELVKEGSEIFPKLIPLASSTEDLQTDTRVVHVKHQGRPASAFKRTKYIEGAVMEFEFHCMDRLAIAEALGGKKIKKHVVTVKLKWIEEIIKHICKYTGFGANRSQGEGKGELISIEEIPQGE